ncbi:hypothetical protein HDV01_007838 [Terramyces sp. JEL0728]|nr:hypothetical protein HDV01_007838 [Terramyces sp. JEL0728]
MLHQISNELYLVGQYLPILEYQHLRIAFINTLPLQQIANPLSLDKQFLEKRDLSHLIAITPAYIADKVILQLFDFGLHQALVDLDIPPAFIPFFMIRIITDEFQLNPHLVSKMLPFIPSGTRGFTGSTLENAKPTDYNSFYTRSNIPYLTAQAVHKGYIDLAKELLSSELVAVLGFPLAYNMYHEELIGPAMTQRFVKSGLGDHDILEYPVKNGMRGVVDIILSCPGVGFLSKNVKLAHSLGHCDIALALLKHKEFNFTDVLAYDLDVFEFVYDSIPIPPKYMDQMFIAATSKNSRIFYSLFDTVIDPSVSGSVALAVASTNNNIPFVTKLLDCSSVDPNVVKKDTKWHAGLLELFLKHPQFKVESGWAVRHCLDINDLHILLGDKRIEPTANNYLLKYAASKADLEMFKLLIPLDFDETGVQESQGVFGIAG